MYKYCRILRNVALFFSLYLLLADSMEFIELTVTGAMSSGVALLILQFITSRIGKQMVLSFKHNSDSDLKKAFLISGLTLGESKGESIIRKFSKPSEILILRCLGLVCFGLGAIAYGVGYGNGNAVLQMLLGATIHLMIAPIASSLSTEKIKG